MSHTDSSRTLPRLRTVAVLLAIFLSACDNSGSGDTGDATLAALGARDIVYDVPIPWQETGIQLTKGTSVKISATGKATYDAGRTTTHYIGPEGDGPRTGWGNCPVHSLVGWVGSSRPHADTPPDSLADVICLGAGFMGAVGGSGQLYLALNDYSGDPGVFGDNAGSWTVNISSSTE